MAAYLKNTYLELTRTKWPESAADFIIKDFIICISHQILFGDHINKGEMGLACGTYG